MTCIAVGAAGIVVGTPVVIRFVPWSFCYLHFVNFPYFLVARLLSLERDMTNLFSVCVHAFLNDSKVSEQHTLHKFGNNRSENILF